jgi:hypothetical protein
MRALLAVLLAAWCAGCATTEKTSVATASVATVPATEDQILLGSRRAEAMVSRLEDTERTKFLKLPAPLLAVRTLPLTPEQVAAAGRPDAATLVPVVLWDAKAEKILGTECYLCGSLPAVNENARFGSHTARYMGSF